MKKKIDQYDLLKLSGESVYLKKFCAEHLEEYAENLLSSSIETTIFTATKALFAKEDIQDYFDTIRNDSSRMDFLIFSKKYKSLVGEVVLSEVDFCNRNASMRISISNKSDFSKGYGSEAIALALNYGFGMMNLHRIELDVLESNERATHVYKKLGFKVEGIKRHATYFNHKYHNFIIMSILEDEFRQLNTEDDTLEVESETL